MYKNNIITEEYEKARQLILKLNKKIKHLIPLKVKAADFKTAGHSELGVGFMKGKAIERVIIILRGPGCAWTQQDEGGCTMCGHYCGSSLGEFIPPEYLKKQFDDAMGRYDFRQYPMLCLYNGGSFLNEAEIAADLRRYMLETIEKNPHIKRLIIESRPGYITDEILDEIETLMPHTEVEIGVGLETTCDIIRNLLLNKGVSTWELVQTGSKFKNRKIRLLVYVLVNPPFLTESEAIEDTIEAIWFAGKMGASVVSLEAVSIQHLTLVAFLAEAGFYTPPWIWSMFEIVKRTLHLGMEIRLGGFEFFPIPKEFTSNCPACNEEMIGKIHQFNRSNDPDVLQNLTCKNRCDLKWKEELKEVDSRSLPQRVIATLEAIDTQKVLKRLKPRSDR